MFSAIVLAGGVGSRMHQPIPKQFLAVAGKPMILHTLERLDQIDEIEEIVIPCHAKYIELLQMQIRAYMLQKSYVVIEGGQSRQDSVLLGLQAAKNEDILIHEAARPFVTKEEFEALINIEAENATYGIDIPFTVSIRTGSHISALLDRDCLVNIQLPQKFKKPRLMEAFEDAKQEGLTFTEDCSLLFHYTETPIAILEGSTKNIKITNEVDLASAEIIYRDYIVGRH